MKIYTKTGDGGDTRLFDGTKVRKYDERVSAYGAIDELNAFIGVARQNLLVHHAPEISAIRALQVFIDDDAHGAMGLPFDQWLLSGRRERQRQERQKQPFAHMRTGYSSVKVKRVSDGI